MRGKRRVCDCVCECNFIRGKNVNFGCAKLFSNSAFRFCTAKRESRSKTVSTYLKMSHVEISPFCCGPCILNSYHARLTKAKEDYLLELDALQKEYAALSDSGICEGQLLVFGDFYRRLNERNTEVLNKEVFHQKAAYKLQREAHDERKRERKEFEKVFVGLSKKVTCLKLQLKLAGVEEGVMTRAQKRQRTSS